MRTRAVSTGCVMVRTAAAATRGESRRSTRSRDCVGEGVRPGPSAVRRRARGRCCEWSPGGRPARRPARSAASSWQRCPARARRGPGRARPLRGEGGTGEEGGEGGELGGTEFVGELRLLDDAPALEGGEEGLGEVVGEGAGGEELEEVALVGAASEVVGVAEGLHDLLFLSHRQAHHYNRK